VFQKSALLLTTEDSVGIRNGEFFLYPFIVLFVQLLPSTSISPRFEGLTDVLLTHRWHWGRGWGSTL